MVDWGGKVDEANEKDDNRLEWSSVLKEGATNIPSSSFDFLKNLFQFAIHPKKTAETLGDTLAGGVQKLVPGKQGSEPQFDAMVDFFADRYGGVENFKKTISEDPVGVLADFSTLVTGAGGAVRGAGIVSKVSKIAKAGKAVQKAGAAIEPLQVAKQSLKIVPTRKMYESAAKFSTAAKKPGESSQVVRQRMTQTALDNSIMPTYKGLEKLEKFITEVNAEIGKAVKKPTDAGVRRSAGQLLKNFDEIEEWAWKWSAEPLKNAAQLKKIKSDFKKVWGIFNKKGKQTAWKTMTPEEIQLKKTTLYKDLENFYDSVKTQPAKIKGSKQIARNAKEILEDIIPEIKELNQRYGPLKELHKALDRVAGRITNRDILGIGIPLKTGAGYAATGGQAMGAGVGLAWGLMDTPVVKAKLAIVIKALQKKLGPISPTQAAVSLGLFQVGRQTSESTRRDGLR